MNKVYLYFRKKGTGASEGALIIGLGTASRLVIRYKPDGLPPKLETTLLFDLQTIFLKRTAENLFISK